MGEEKNLTANRKIYHPTPMPLEESSSLRNVLSILFRQKFHIIVFFITTVVAVTVITLLTPEIYQSDAKLFIQLGRESMSVDPSVVGPITSVRSSRESELNSEVAAITSRILAEQVVDEIGPITILEANDDDPVREGESQQADLGMGLLVRGLLVRLGLKDPLPLQTLQQMQNEIAVTKLMEDLTAGVGKKSHIIDVSIQAASPQLAQVILNVLVDKYLDRHIEMHQAQAPLQFFEERTEELKTALEQKEGLLRKFQTKNSMSSMEGQKAMVLEQVSLMQTEIDQVTSLIGASRAKIESIEASLEGRSPSREINRVIGRPNRSVETIKDRLFDLRAQEVDLAARYPDTDRALVDLRDKISLTESLLGQESETHTEITQGVDTNYQALQLNLANEQAQLQALRARQKILLGQLTKRQADLLELAGQEINLKRIQREINIASSEHQQYRENLQRAKISADLDSGRISNVRIVQPPTMSLVPIKPRKKLNILLGILLGMTGGLGLAFFREYFDNTIKNPEDVEDLLGVPVLASISRKEFETCI